MHSSLTDPQRGTADVCYGRRLLEDGTVQWMQELVIGHGLCPWAAAAMATARICIVEAGPQDLSCSTALAKAEARALLEAAGASDEPLQDARRQGEVAAISTTLLVFGHKRYDGPGGLGAFQELWQAVEGALGFPQVAVGSVKLLAFHPCREDRGPGCRSSPLDAGHYGARAPFPVLQLLRSSDLEAARRSWAARHGGPGALELLLRNKAKLRALGRRALASLLEAFRRG